MSSIVTFLGKGGTGRTINAIATAKKLATEGKKVLLMGQDSSPAWGIALGLTPTTKPQEISANFAVMQLNAAILLENSWEQVKQMEAQYLRSPILKQVYGGIDTLRMFGMPEILSWYFRRFQDIFTESDIVKTLSPFVQPATSAVLNTSWTANDIADNADNPATQMLEEAKTALNKGNVFAYLVTTPDPTAIATAKYLWGSAQQVGLGVGGVLCNGTPSDAITTEFAPLKVTSLPKYDDGDWQPLIDALPSMANGADIPKSTEFVMAERKIKVYLPGFEKKDVKLTQYGPEITIEAGDQRRNITLPPAWRGSSVIGAKFQNGYLEVTVG